MKRLITLLAIFATMILLVGCGGSGGGSGSLVDTSEPGEDHIDLETSEAIDDILDKQDDSLGKALRTLTDKRDDYAIMSDKEIKDELNSDFYIVVFRDINGETKTDRMTGRYNGEELFQQLRYGNGVGREPMVYESHFQYTLNDGIIEIELWDTKYQVRRIADGYYVMYEQDSNGDYSIPGQFLMEVYLEDYHNRDDYSIYDPREMRKELIEQ